MGYFNKNQNEKTSFNYLFYVFLFVFLSFLIVVSFSCTASSSSSSHEIQPRISASTAHIKSRYQVLYIKKTKPFFLNQQQQQNKRSAKMMMKKKRSYSNKYYSKTKPFSVMLPKGFVPPSGSSPCHNTNPESVAFYCALSTPKP
ncbi:hypothetical protein Ddye_024591 [Dipteronia dyeriana]|uniref:Uncharacterized protein n=1 Tax=Dipteronia dyeriana TaxID=168575 RepID=A0AAD9WUC0_9ROSI|nr:hypothetical protein Ddye_024591 [Dipteronia dyeriana]